MATAMDFDNTDGFGGKLKSTALGDHSGSFEPSENGIEHHGSLQLAQPFKSASKRTTMDGASSSSEFGHHDQFSSAHDWHSAASSADGLHASWSSHPLSHSTPSAGNSRPSSPFQRDSEHGGSQTDSGIGSMELDSTEADGAPDSPDSDAASGDDTYAGTAISSSGRRHPALALTSDHPTVPIAVAAYKGFAALKWNQLGAASFLSIVPMIAFALFAQRHIVRGLTAGMSR